MLPYTSRAAFTVHGNKAKNVVVKVPSRGVIKNIVCVQTVGEAEGYTFELFTNRDVAPPDGEPVAAGPGVDYLTSSLGSDDSITTSESVSRSSSSVSSSSAGSTPPKILYSVFGLKSTNDEDFFEFDKTYVYVCDGGPTNRKRELYLRITPSGSNEDVKAFELKLDIAVAGMVN